MYVWLVQIVAVECPRKNVQKSLKFYVFSILYRTYWKVHKTKGSGFRSHYDMNCGCSNI